MTDRILSEQPAPKRPDFPPNPAFGMGATRRQVRLVGTPGRVQAILTDTFHELRCTVLHADGRVTAIHGETLRVPTTACPAAAGLLEELRGLPIATPMAELYAGGRHARNCTHLFDLAALAIAHAGRGIATRIYMADVPDETDAPVAITASCDGASVHHWLVRDGVILAPAPLAGRPVRRGFAAWAPQVFEGVTLEAATILSRTYLIAYGAGILHETGDGKPVGHQQSMLGVCYAYAPERADIARFVAGNRRNFDDGVVETPWPGVTD